MRLASFEDAIGSYRARALELEQAQERAIRANREQIEALRALEHASAAAEQALASLGAWARADS